MRIRSFIIAYALVLALLLFADRRPNRAPGDHYSHVIDLTSGAALDGGSGTSATRIIAPAAMIPGTWSAGQIPPERLIAPLVVMDLSPRPEASQITLDDIATWEARHGVVAQGAIVAIRRGSSLNTSTTALPITDEAAQFLMDARYVLGFVIDTQSDLASDRPLARRIALHGSYVI